MARDSRMLESPRKPFPSISLALGTGTTASTRDHILKNQYKKGSTSWVHILADVPRVFGYI